MRRAGIVLLALFSALLAWCAATQKREAAEAWRARGEDVRAQERRIEDLERRLAAATRELEDARREAWMDGPASAAPNLSSEWPDASKRLGFGQERPSEETPVPAIRGTIQASDVRADVCIVSVGSEDGVKVGHEFTVFRGDRYVSTIVIDAVFPQHASGHTKSGMKKSEIEAGDRVATASAL